jgi:4-hydroxythreonine-4-phosphate dehydrogenase
MPKPVVGITVGDPAGIGPEIVSKALNNRRVQSLCQPVVFGTARFLNTPTLKTDPVRGHDNIIQAPFERSHGGTIVRLFEVEVKGTIESGKRSANSGKAAMAYLDAAIRAAQRHEIDVLVTAPVSKSAIRMAGMHSFVGHTEYLAQVTGARLFAMMFYSKRLRVTLVTTHLPLKDVATSVTSKKILGAITLSNDALKKLGFDRPRIGVAGINPHAGEEKAFGDEDVRIVAPAVRKARERGIDAQGPVPADTLFRAAYKGEYDLVVAMYHDQALAPFKMIAFDEGVNVTLGLPFVRTSVDHGTAFEIAGKGVASEKSLVEAIKLAVRLCT